MSLAEARDACREDQKKAHAGIDPRSTDSRKSNSYISCVEDYVNLVQIRKKGARHAECKRLLLSYCTDWHQLPVATIRQQQLEHLLIEIRDKPHGKRNKPRPYLSTKLWATWRPFFMWCAKRNLVKLSPMLHVDKPLGRCQATCASLVQRKSAADTAIKQLWSVANQLEASQDEQEKLEGKYLKLMVLLGKRMSALVNMKWEHIEDWFGRHPKPRHERNIYTASLCPRWRGVSSST